MTTAGEGCRTCPDEIPLLTFAVQGVRMAADADQIDAMFGLEEASVKGLAICHLHDRIRLSGPRTAYRSPKVLALKESPGCGVVIDEPEDVIPVSVKDIRPLPGLLAGSSPGPVWGVLVSGEAIVMLVDLLKLWQADGESVRPKNQLENNRSQS